MHYAYNTAGRQITFLPNAGVCGSSFPTDHAPSCPTGGFPSIHHNEIQDISVTLLIEVCSSVTVEPPLQPLFGEVLPGASAITGPEARSDISACGFGGGRFEGTFFDVLEFSPFVRSNLTFQIGTAHQRQEPQKRDGYDPVFFLPYIFCVPVRKLGTSVRKSTAKSDLQNLQNQYQCR